MNYGILIGLLVVFVASFAGVAAFRRWSLRRGMLDVPNERSSHVTPTPRGGGLVIAAVVIAFYLTAACYVGEPVSIGFVAGAVLIVGISWLDDIYSLPFFVRLGIHFVAAVAVIATEGPITGLTLPFWGGTINFSVLSPIITGVWIVWLVNAYNFMDGIDGIAGLQAVVAGVGWLAFGYANGSPMAVVLGGSIAAASIGFLLHNWQPARIFMGDAGSAFLGFVFAAMPLVVLRKTGEGQSGVSFLIAIAFVWIFLLDSVFTFLRRLIRREEVWRAHRSHIYQRLVISGISHAKVTIVYGILSATVALSVFWGLTSLGLALIISPIILLALLFARGRQVSGDVI